MSHAEYVVCTFTSNVCRYVYELMQSQIDNSQIDASFRIKSLDNHFYVDSFNTFTKIAIMDHMPKNSNELEIKKGDIIEFHCREPARHNKNLFCNLRNGYMKGINQRTDKKGILPAYKVVNYFTSPKYSYPGWILFLI